MKSVFRALRLSQLDRALKGARKIPPRPKQGWIASVREALGFTLMDLGTRIGATRQAVQQFEKAEAEGRITLRMVRRVAEAMDCELIYALVPRNGTFQELAQKPIRARALQDVESVLHTMALEDQKPRGVTKRLVDEEVKQRLGREKSPKR